MKAINFLSIAGLGLVFSVSASAQNLQYHITGRLVNISPMPAKMYLTETSRIGVLSKPADSAVVRNGEYHFDGQLNTDEAMGVTICSASQETRLRKLTELMKNYTPQTSNIISKLADDILTLIVDKGNLVVISTGSIANYKVSGNGVRAHHQYEAWNRQFKAHQDSIKMVSTGEAYKNSANDIIRNLMKVIPDDISRMYQYVKAHPGDRFSPYAAISLSGMNYLTDAQKDTLLLRMPQTVKTDLVGKALQRSKVYRDSLEEVKHDRIIIGSKALDFTQNDPAGNPVSLSSFKGRYVLVDFWASWCGWCRLENPYLIKNYRKYKDMGFTVLGVSLDDVSGKGAWIKAIANDGLVWTQVCDLKGGLNDVAVLYNIRGIPSNFLVSPNGTIIAKNLRGDELSAKLAEIFDKK